MITKTDQIRALNDELREHLPGGLAVITPGVAALGQEAVERIVKTIAVYTCDANDSHDEHDFGAFDAFPSSDIHVPTAAILNTPRCRCLGYPCDGCQAVLGKGMKYLCAK
jgi:hypothetical protein